MFPWLRLIRVGLTLVGTPRVELLATTRVTLRVWPNDLDLNLHVNNGRYLALADISRMHWFASTGVLAIARQNKVFPIVGDVIAKFRRDLKVFETFEIHTRLMGWDHKWGFLEHRFVRNQRVIGVVAIRGVFNGATGLPRSRRSAERSRARRSVAATARVGEFLSARQRTPERVAARESAAARGLRARNG